MSSSDGCPKEAPRLGTRLLHDPAAGAQPAPDATMPAIWQSSAFAHESAAELEAIFHNARPGYSYTRVGNPTTAAFERRMAQVEGGRTALACASGMAAIFNLVAGTCAPGGEVVASDCLYGGTLELLADLERLGITVRRVPRMTPAALEEAAGPNTRLVFAETISNPKLDVIDVAALARKAHELGLPLAVDNTVASPALCRPLELGADLVVESTSKYVNGGGNSISGCLVDAGRFRWDPARYPALDRWAKMGPFALMANLRNGLWRDTGACLAPMNAFLNCVGLETLEVRMDRACANALALATWLQESGLTDGVSYLGLPDAPGHELAAAQFGGRFGAMLTLRVGSKERAFQVIDSLRWCLRASNIGDTKTLVLHPASTIFCDQTPAERLAAGVTDDLIRVSVGIEDARDLIDDFDQALSGLA